MFAILLIPDLVCVVFGDPGLELSADNWHINVKESDPVLKFIFTPNLATSECTKESLVIELLASQLYSIVRYRA